MQISDFKKFIWEFYKEHKREMPWRRVDDPYKVYVSEIMLQQTQVNRVRTKYAEFIAAFPTFQALSEAPTDKLLAAWQGMGYNRRALYMRETAKRVMGEFGGKLPDNPRVLETFPGIGKATAGSLVAFSYNKPTVFIETNIRRVYIHHFFPTDQSVHDAAIFPLVEQTVDQENPREWYYALMDYGTTLPKLGENANKRSKHYTLQSKFEGSDRQLRGRIIRELVQKGSLSTEDMLLALEEEIDRIEKIAEQLQKEGFIKKKGSIYTL